MRDFPSCFGESGVQVADASCSSIGVNKASQNLVTCIYKCKLLGKFYLINIIWSKNLMGQCLSIEIEDLNHNCLFKVDVKPSLFTKRKGSKCLEVYSCKIEVFWDLSLAKFGSSPEPLEGYYIAIVCKKEMVLAIGDLKKEAFKKTSSIPSFPSATLVSKREHISGKKVYLTKSQFGENGAIHDVKIECDTRGDHETSLVIRVDSKPVMQVKNLRWKFRGNYTILVDGFPVELFWDVHNWLFSPGLGYAVFMFQTCSSAEKPWTSHALEQPSLFALSCSESFVESRLPGHGFSLFLYAWKNE